MSPLRAATAVTYERELTATGSIKVFAVTEAARGLSFTVTRKLLAIAQTPLAADDACHRNEVLLELDSLAEALRTPGPEGAKKFWRLATARLRAEKSIPPHVKYRMKRECLGMGLRKASVDGRQMSLLYSK